MISLIEILKKDKFVCLLFAFLVSLVFIPVSSYAQLVCSIDQITDTTAPIILPRTNAIKNPSISADGSRIVFTSNGDITGDNSDLNRELFLFNIDTGTFTQITDTTGGDSIFTTNVNPSTNSDGSLISFASDRDLTGSNADLNPELFLFDTSTSIFTQVTDTTGGQIFAGESVISLDGNSVIFSTSDNSITGNNPDFNFELFQFDISSSTFTQITQTTDEIGNFQPSINSGGSLIAFSSDNNIIGENPDGNIEIFLFNVITITFIQVTNTTVAIGSEFSSISSDGSQIAFNSFGDLTGENPDGNIEIFLFDTTTSTITQITDTLFGNNGFASINSDGSRIAFESMSDITGENPDGNTEIFHFDTTTDTFTQVTDTVGGILTNLRPSINGDGNLIAFNSISDITGENPDGNIEIFLAECLNDSDGDGVADSEDSCPDSDISSAVIIDGCDSEVVNTINILGEDGCTISDLISEIEDSISNHGRFVSEVSKLLNQLKREGVITGREKGAIQSCAGEADIS